jgi:hypothetical protein
MDDKQNANPTILSLSDLPSRRRGSNVRRRDDGGTGLFDDLIPQYDYLNDPFEQPLSSSDSDDDSVEDIDEQEVYGAFKGPSQSQRAGFQSHCPMHSLTVSPCRPDLVHL